MVEDLQGDLHHVVMEAIKSCSSFWTFSKKIFGWILERRVGCFFFNPVTFVTFRLSKNIISSWITSFETDEFSWDSFLFFISFNFTIISLAYFTISSYHSLDSVASVAIWTKVLHICMYLLLISVFGSLPSVKSLISIVIKLVASFVHFLIYKDWESYPSQLKCSESLEHDHTIHLKI